MKRNKDEKYLMNNKTRWSSYALILDDIDLLQ